MAQHAPPLISGDVDFIERVAPSDLPNLEKRDGVSVYKSVSNRLYMTLHMTHEPVKPYVKTGTTMNSVPISGHSRKTGRIHGDQPGGDLGSRHGWFVRPAANFHLKVTLDTLLTFRRMNITRKRQSSHGRSRVQGRIQ